MKAVAKAFAVLFGFALVGVVAFPIHAAADEDPAVVIQVRDATLDGQPGRGRSLVLLQIGPGASVQAFELTLEFDPEVILPVDTNPSEPGIQLSVDRFWSAQSSTEIDITAGELRVAGSSGSRCTSGDCVLFTVGWEAISIGESGVTVSEFSLSGTGVDSAFVSVIDGIVIVAQLPGVAAAESSELDPARGAQALSDSSQGRVLLGLGAVALLGAATLAVVFARQIAARFGGSRRGTSSASPLSPAEETAVSDYFDRLESGEPRAPGRPGP